MSFEVQKSPVADLDYSIDWALWLGSATIASSAWTITAVPNMQGSSLTQHNAGLDSGSRIATVWLSGGGQHGAYDVANSITDSLGRSDERTIRVTMMPR